MTTQTQQSDKPTTGATYHFILTLQAPNRAGFAAATSTGTCTLNPGTTRQDAYNQIRARLTAAHPGLANGDVVFFSLEPNQL